MWTFDHDFVFSDVRRIPISAIVCIRYINIVVQMYWIDLKMVFANLCIL